MLFWNRAKKQFNVRENIFVDSSKIVIFDVCKIYVLSLSNANEFNQVTFAKSKLLRKSVKDFISR